MHSTDAAHCYIRRDVRSSMCTSVSVSVWRAHSWILQKRMNRSKCRLGEELTWAQGTIFQMGIHIGAVWQIWLNDPWAGAGDDVALCQITLNTWFCYSARNSAARATTTMTTAAPFDSRAFFSRTRENYGDATAEQCESFIYLTEQWQDWRVTYQHVTTFARRVRL